MPDNIRRLLLSSFILCLSPFPTFCPLPFPSLTLFSANGGTVIATRTRKPQSTRPDAARQFAVEVARLAAKTRCHQVVVLDVRGLSPVTDYFVLATGTSPRQMKTVCDDVTELARELKYTALSQSGLDGDSWMLVDFVDVMFHIFSEPARSYYDLDGLWGDAKIVEWEDAADKASVPTGPPAGGDDA